MPSTHPTIGAKIRWYRRNAGLTLRELGSRAKLHFSQIGDWERGEADPSYGQTEKLAEAFAIRTETLWNTDPPPPTALGALKVHIRR